MPQIGMPELIIILVIAILIFGVGRVGELGGALGKSIHDFKKGMQSGENPSKDKPAEPAAADAAATPKE